MTEDAMAHDVATTLRSELAALQYKRDRLLAELQDMKGQLRCREQRALELQVESDQLREQAARQSSVIASLRKRVQELEERERSASCSLGRSELAVQTLQRESRQASERVSELEAKLRRLELECHEEEGLKDAARTALSDLVRRLATALGAELVDASPEVLLVRAAELVQEAGRLRTRAGNMCESLQSAEQELRNCREALQRQQAAHMCEMDRVKQDKEAVEMAHRCTERELSEVREKLAVTSRSLGACTTSCAQQESAICSLREEVKIREEKWMRLQNELRHLLESLAIMVSSPSRFVESTEGCIKERIREILSDNKDLVVQMDTLRDKACGLQQQLGRQSEIAESASCRARVLEEDKAILESRLHKVESDLTACDVAREALRRDKCTFMEFLDRLGRALNMEEVSKDIGVDMHTEALLVRADQLARLESDKMVDKTAAVYQLQRRVRTLREQLQRRDLHLDLLRRKLALQVDSCRARAVVESERDEISLRAKKLQKKVDCLQLQLAEARTLNRDLKAQLADAADCKITALERARRIEELQKRLMDAEVVRTQYNRKVNILKDQVRATAQSANQERSLGEHAAHLLREDLTSSKAALSEAARKETQLLSFRSSVCKLLGVDLPASDYEILARLQKLIAAHRDFTLVSRRWDHNEPLPLAVPCAVPCTPPPPVRPLSPHRPLSARCLLADDLTAELNSVLDDIDDINGIYNKRPHRLAS
ncbi:hypothetical protein FOCC_FOCC003015 [Frankliniella occidentalis]|nr:hypothetical protein FOCC_FOCC003015 [Frankliniella occidentalis]